jgi:hypothetical protein
MPNRRKEKETNHERAIVNRYRDNGFYSIRAPASLGKIDGISFKPDLCVCWASRSYPWTLRDMLEIKQEMAKFMPKGWKLLFFEFSRGGPELVIDSENI